MKKKKKTYKIILYDVWLVFHETFQLDKNAFLFVRDAAALHKDDAETLVTMSDNYPVK